MRHTVMIACMLMLTSCTDGQQSELRERGDSGDGILTVVLSGQTILLTDPRESWDDPFGSIRPILQSADVAFTNFEAVVMEPDNRCGLPDWYIPLMRQPLLLLDRDRPGDRDTDPSVAEASVMEFLSDVGFNLMSLANNHSWDLGACGVEATRAAAARYGIVHAGTGSSTEQATAPAYLSVDGATVALLASTTSNSEREVWAGQVNGVWLAQQDDWDRNLAAVREAARNADVVIYYQHFQLIPQQMGRRGHGSVDSLERWQTDFARAVIDAGATVYIAHGDRVFDGVEIYEGRPIFRQLGPLLHQVYTRFPAVNDDYSSGRGVLAELTLRDGAVESIEVLPVDIYQGEAGVDDYNTLDRDDQIELDRLLARIGATADQIELDRLLARIGARMTFLKRRTTAELATGSLALDILESFRQRSANYGTEVEIRGERAVIHLNERD